MYADLYVNVQLEQQHDGSQVRRKALEQLCPAAFQRHFDGVSLVEDNPRISSKKAQYDLRAHLRFETDEVCEEKCVKLRC